MNIAVVLAGGVGARIGAGIPKQFIEVLGKPIMIYTLETFQKDPLIDEIVLVCVRTHMDLAKEYCKKYGISKVRSFVEGGDSFLGSSINGVKSLAGKCSPDDIVVITSADRPFISMEEIDDSIRVCLEHGSGVAARDCAVCMFRVGKDRSHSHAYERDNLVQIATPWTFRRGLLMDAIDRYEAGEFPGCEPYPAAVFAAAGNELYFSKAFARNIKITEKTDLPLMEAMLKEQLSEKR